MSDTVLPVRGMKSVAHMNAVGYTVVAGLAIVLLPVLPFLLVLYLLGRRWSSSPEPRFVPDAAE